MALSSQLSNALIYLTYGAMLVSGIAVALWKTDKSTFLSDNGTRTGVPLALNFIATG